MSILRLAGVTREVGTLRIIDGVDAAVAARDRIGLVGANGAGKTTLLRLAAGLDEPDSGRVERKRGLSIALLAQEAGLEADFRAAPHLRAYVRWGASKLESIESELRALEDAGADQVAGARYEELQHRFEALGGYLLDQRVDEALSGLGFDREAWSRPPAALSGGEQTRAALARTVLADPDLLLLDEPTNHLDLAALEWLETALLRRAGALIVASHDRAFLDAVPERIWELRERRLTTFRGGYGAYALQREERDARLRREGAARDAEMAREERLVATYRSHRKFGKMHEHEARLARLQPVDAPRDGRGLAIPTAALTGRAVRSGEVAFSLQGAVVGFPDRRLVAVPRFEARRGDRIGVVGPNGVGKTTLLRTLAGELPLLDGAMRIDRLADVGYLAQLRTVPLVGDTILDAVLARAGVLPGEARTHLARFLFTGDDVFKLLTVLSGGERSRLELALLGLMPSNLFLLDEPTNHLDIPAREALEAFVRESGATAVVVSHDRRLLDATCTRLLVIAAAASVPGAEPPVAAEAVAVPFEGSYSAWRSAVAAGWNAGTEAARLMAGAGSAVGGPQPRRARTVGAEASAGAADVRREAVTPLGGPQPGRARGWGASRSEHGPTGARGAARGRPAVLSKDAYRRRKSVVEADMTRLGLRRSQIELALGDPSVQSNFVELRRLTSELADVEAALGAAEDAWLTLEEVAPR